MVVLRNTLAYYEVNVVPNEPFSQFISDQANAFHRRYFAQ